MKLFDGIRDWAGRRALRNEKPVQRRVAVRNFADCDRIGILYLAHDEQAHEHVRNFVKKIKEDLGHHKINVLGYHNAQELPAYLHPRLHFDAFMQKDLHWNRVPQGSAVQSFLNEEFDVLIDLTLEDSLPVQFVLAKSKARFKVGRMSDTNKELLDMMIDTAGGNSLTQFIVNANKYLMMVNAKDQVDLDQ